MFKRLSPQGLILYCAWYIFIIVEDCLQTRALFRRNAGEQLRRGSAIVHVGPRDQHGHQQVERVDQQMSLAACDFLAAVTAPLRAAPVLAAHVRRLRRLAVDAGCAGRLIATGRLTNLRHNTPTSLVNVPLSRHCEKFSYAVLLCCKSCGNRVPPGCYWQPVR